MGRIEGHSAKGIFSTGGRGFSFRRARQRDAVARFADALAHHIDQADLDAGRNLATGAKLSPDAALDPGGKISVAARRAGIHPKNAHSLFARMRRQLGPQAR